MTDNNRRWLNPIAQQVKDAQSAPQPVQAVMPIQTAADVTFNMASIVYIDVGDYEPGDTGRFIVMGFASGAELKFEQERADDFYKWYVSLFGQVANT